MTAAVLPRLNRFAVLTSPGPAAIAVVRAAGPALEPFLTRHLRPATRRGRSPRVGALAALRPGDVLRAWLLDESGAPLDDMVLTVHAREPDWDVRFHVHGGVALVRELARMLERAGLVATSPADWPVWTDTRLLDVELHALLPSMTTLRGARWLAAQPARLREAARVMLSEADLAVARAHCRALLARRHVVEWFRTPLRIALVGPPNAGKSTLINALADRPVALVSDSPGTTRDRVEAPGQIDGFPVVWTDTAGLRRSDDDLEGEAIRRTLEQLAAVDSLVVVLDGTVLGEAASGKLADPADPTADFLRRYAHLDPACVALNKSDLGFDARSARRQLPGSWPARSVEVSATRRRGLDELGAAVVQAAGRRVDEGLAAPFTDRQCRVLEEALDSPSRDRFRERILMLDKE